MKLKLSLTLALLLGCASCGAETVVRCRAPSAYVTPVEGQPASMCSVNFDACQDQGIMTLHCDNRTYGGDYECMWTRVAGLSVKTGTFRSTDICRLDVAGMTERFSQHTELDIALD